MSCLGCFKVLNVYCSVLEPPKPCLVFEAPNFAVALLLPQPAIATLRMLGTASCSAFWLLMLKGEFLQAEPPGLLCPQCG